MTLENISEIYNICTDCIEAKNFCTYKPMKCLRLNLKLSKNKILYRYFPHAPEKKTWA